MNYASRRQRLLAQLTTEGLDAYLISHPVNVTYLTGFTGDSTYLIVGKQKTLLVSDGRYTVQLAEECPGLEAFIRPPAQLLPQAVAEVLTRLAARSVGFESHHLSVADFEVLRDAVKSAEWKGARDRVERLRAIKDADEIEQTREAVRFAERAFVMFRAMLALGDSEVELAYALENYIRRAGGSGCSFPPIVAVGERAALPHAPPTNRTVNGADLLLVDWGAAGRFYKSDLTRVLTGHNNSKPVPHPGRDRPTSLAAVYDVVLRAQEKAIRTLRPGVKTGEVDAAARGVIAEAGFGDYFTHSVGHGVGLQIHEAPTMRPGSENVLQPGMIVTVEPGVYLPGWGGIRIEDDVLITADGHEVLSHVPKELAAMGLDAS
jgi:Xaa-Pro aminopeptidase